MSNWVKYRNGNYDVWLDLESGTKIRANNKKFFKAEVPENIDLKITDKCFHNCKFCYASSCEDGKHGDIMNLNFLDSWGPYKEVSIGGGNALLHPHLIPFLHKLKSLKIIANITINQRDFMLKETRDLLNSLIKQKLVYGIGVSLVSPDRQFIKQALKYPNLVIHVINGIVSVHDLEKLSDQRLKILILGYKNIGRGEDNLNEDCNSIILRQKALYNKLPTIMGDGWFTVVSFDNLALHQLNPKRFIDEKIYKKLYLGNDGEASMYIDAVNNTFAKGSISKENRPLTNNIKDMFAQVQEL